MKPRHQVRSQVLFYVALADIKPAIWRRFLVPGSYILDAVHEVIQVVMGWQNYHLYEFSIGGQRFIIPDPEEPGPEPLDPRTVTLHDLGLTQGATLSYTYDFGDDWRHDLAVEGIAPHSSLSFIPTCLGGARACPPEDCGGPHGYMELLRAVRKPRSALDRERLAWLGDGFDPEAIDLGPINRRLSGPRPRSARRGQSRSRHRAV